MKIAHIAYQTWPTQVGSVSRLNKVLESQKVIGHSVFIVSGPFQEGNTCDLIEEYRGDKYYRFSGRNLGFFRNGGWGKRVRKFLDIFSYIPFLKRTLENENPDVIHAHATFVVGLASIVVGFLMKKPVVYEVRSTWEEDLVGGMGVWLQKKIIFFLELLTIKLCDTPIFISRGLAEHYLGSSNKEIIIYNSMRDPLVEQKELDDVVVFGYLGTFAYYEGLEYLFQAVAQLKSRYEFKVRLAGSGEMEQKYIEAVQSLGINDVVSFLGKIDPVSVAEFYRSVDIVVLPRKNLLITNRVAGLKPIEAFAFKKLVIASDVGGMEELFENNKHGWMFEAESVSSLVERMELVLNREFDIKPLCDSGYKHFKENFTSLSMGNAYSSVYSALI